MIGQVKNVLLFNIVFVKDKREIKHFRSSLWQATFAFAYRSCYINFSNVSNYRALFWLSNWSSLEMFVGSLFNLYLNFGRKLNVNLIQDSRLSCSTARDQSRILRVHHRVL